jgi:hypothetical protein
MILTIYKEKCRKMHEYHTHAVQLRIPHERKTRNDALEADLCMRENGEDIDSDAQAHEARTPGGRGLHDGVMSYLV